MDSLSVSDTPAPTAIPSGGGQEARDSEQKQVEPSTKPLQDSVDKSAEPGKNSVKMEDGMPVIPRRNIERSRNLQNGE